ncbi:MAG: sodium/glutamate symporter [Bacteroidales bacterium]|nr:sodium/glutamate symporter [Bacteroidales bacterium]
MQISLDLYQTAATGVLALLLGMFLTSRLSFLKRFCIPAPVSGGVLFSLISLLLYSIAGVGLSFDATLKDVCMMIFFTSVGFQSNLTILKQGGKPLIMMVLLVLVIIFCQNLLSVGISLGMGLDPLFGMCAGSIPMSGGHGTAGGFSPVLESLGVEGAASITMAAATFGLVAGSLIGGPIAERLIRKKKLKPESGATMKDSMASLEVNEVSPEARKPYSHSDEDAFLAFSKAVFLIIIAMGLGSLLSRLLALTGITFPTYFGSLIVAALIRNLSELFPSRTAIKTDKIVSIGNICLSLFLGMAMVSLRLWELADLALPLLLMLLAQILFLGLFAAFVAFPLLGKDYDAAVLTSGICGFGLGATPNAMANMSAVCYKYSYSVKPFVIVPLVGAMFVDIINTAVITLFLNLL